VTATLGIQIVPLDQVQAIAASLKTPMGSDAMNPGTPVNVAGAMVKAGPSAGGSDVGKIAEKVVKNVSLSSPTS